MRKVPAGVVRRGLSLCPSVGRVRVLVEAGERGAAWTVGRRQAMQLVRDWVEQLGLVAGSLQVLQSWEDPWSLDACLCAVSIAVRDVCQPVPR